MGTAPGQLCACARCRAVRFGRREGEADGSCNHASLHPPFTLAHRDGRRYVRKGVDDMFHAHPGILLCVYHRTFAFREDGTLQYAMMAGAWPHTEAGGGGGDDRVRD
jgi:hypothetical protein